jgi:hypothetical protein
MQEMTGNMNKVAETGGVVSTAQKEDADEW